MLKMRKARLSEAFRIYKLHCAAALTLRNNYGYGPWARISFIDTFYRVLFKRSVFVFESASQVIAVCGIEKDRIHFYRSRWFTGSDDGALYVRAMSVHPEWQRRGFGRSVMQLVEDFGRDKGYESIRLDAYQGPAGAGLFYRKCGYSHRLSDILDGIPLEIYENNLA